MQLRVRGTGLEIEVLGASFRVESKGNRSGFQQRGLTTPVLTNDKGYLRMQLKVPK